MPTATHTPSAFDRNEVEKFAALASDWWNADGNFAALHRLNPVRLGFIRDATASHFNRDRHAVRCFQGLRLLDIGCGGGLLSEPLTRIGYDVIGIDPAKANVEAARAHAVESSLGIDYRCATIDDLDPVSDQFDVVLCMEVVEHVADLRTHLRTSSRLVAAGGLMFVATINKTLKSLLLAKLMAEYVLHWLPAGTHDWERFVEPAALRRMLEESGLNPLKTQGIGFNLLSWAWQLSAHTDVNYMIVAGR